MQEREVRLLYGLQIKNIKIMIGLFYNFWEGDGYLVKELEGIFESKNLIPESYKRDWIRKDYELQNTKPEYNRCIDTTLDQIPPNEDDGGYSYAGFYTIEEIELNTILRN